MQMVEAEMSGVCFTRNLWGEASELMIEAVYGQGEGLVSGELTPDRYVVDKYSTKLVYQSVTEQTHMFVRSSNQDGVIKVAFEEPRQGPVLDSKKVRVSMNESLYDTRWQRAPSCCSANTNLIVPGVCRLSPLLREPSRTSTTALKTLNGPLTSPERCTFSSPDRLRPLVSLARSRSSRLVRAFTPTTPSISLVP